MLRKMMNMKNKSYEFSAAAARIEKATRFLSLSLAISMRGKV